MDKLEDYIGQKFNMLTVIGVGSKVTSIGRRYDTFDCRCDCGNISKNIIVYEVIKGRIKSCGCLLHRKGPGIHQDSMTHGFTSQYAPRWKRLLYQVWADLKQRCNNPKTTNYDDYGGRGITYAPEWEDFETFKDWAIDHGYREGVTLDRIDVNGNYEPDNCRWVDWTIQANNKRDNVIIKVGDEIHTIAEWARITGAKSPNIQYRYEDAKYDPSIAIDPEYLRNKTKQLITFEGETHDIREWAKIKGLTYSIINWRIKNGWDVEKALNTPSKNTKSTKTITVDGEEHTVQEWSQINGIGITTIYERISRGWSEEAAVTIPPHSGVVHEPELVMA